jgi:hypothetical protein
MIVSTKRILVCGTCIALGIVIVILVKFRDSSVVTAPLLEAARASSRDATVSTLPVPLHEDSAVVLPANWEKEYNDTRNYFDFVSKAARKAFDGDGRAALYISKALYVCLPIAKQYANSTDPEADFNAHWAGMTKAPQWVSEKARKDFQSCVGFIKGDAFAGLPDRPGGYSSIRYWTDEASKDSDPLAQSFQAGSDISEVAFAKSSDSSAKSLVSAQAAINSAVESKDPAALFQVGQLLSDGHASSDPLQGFAVSIAACDLGYDCTASNAELFHGCVTQGTCPPGISYSDIVKKAVGADGYVQAYARAQQIEEAMARGDTSAVQQFVQLNPAR